MDAHKGETGGGGSPRIRLFSCVSCLRTTNVSAVCMQDHEMLAVRRALLTVCERDIHKNARIIPVCYVYALLLQLQNPLSVCQAKGVHGTQLCMTIHAALTPCPYALISLWICIAVPIVVHASSHVQSRPPY
jgi:hypothetical protein